MSNEFYLGRCIKCGKVTTLKEGKCPECYENDIPEFMKEMLKEKPDVQL